MLPKQTQAALNSKKMQPSSMDRRGILKRKLINQYNILVNPKVVFSKEMLLTFMGR